VDVWAFKLSFDVDILVFWATFSQKLGEILLSFLVTLMTILLYNFQFGSLVGCEVFTPRQFYVIMAIVLYLLCALITFLFRTFIF
jgi:hypothetical protein